MLCEVLAQTYGKGKLARANLDVPVIAERSGRQRQNVWRGVRELRDAGVIELQQDGSYLFRKNYAKWRNDKGTLVDSRLQKYCAGYPLLAKSFEPQNDPESGESTVDSPSTVPYEPRESTYDSQTESTVDSRRESQVDSVSGIPPTPPLVCGRSIGELRSAAAREDGEPISIDAASSRTPDYPGDDGSLRPLPGPYELADADARGIHERTWRAFKSKPVCNGFFEEQRRFPADVWIAAFDRAKRNKVKFRTIAYVIPIGEEILERNAAVASGKPTGSRRLEGETSATGKLPVFRASNDPRKPTIKSKNAISQTPAKEHA